MTTSPLCEQWALFYEVHGPDSRDPGAGSPENLKTVTSGSLAVPVRSGLRPQAGTGASPPVKCVSGF
ncbi:hypothetical protein B8W70_02630 [Pseudomonas sp. 1239]|nr:hypothetical protein MF6396_13125 [Pseudomonas sp. MF6396]OUM35241.1 hypothetical protein B8W70_02630 [Pseudomonas sp. 1239]